MGEYLVSKADSFNREEKKERREEERAAGEEMGKEGKRRKVMNLLEYDSFS